MRESGPAFVQLAAALKQINAPLGQLGKDSLIVSTVALNGSDPNDATYNRLESQLAARTGVDVRKITALEAGRFDPPFDVMSALADGIGVPLYALMPDHGEKRQAT